MIGSRSVCAKALGWEARIKGWRRDEARQPSGSAAGGLRVASTQPLFTLLSLLQPDTGAVRRVSTVACVHAPRCQPPDCSATDPVGGAASAQGRFWRGAACDELDCGPANCSQHRPAQRVSGGSVEAAPGPVPRSRPRPGPVLTRLSWSCLGQLAAAVKLDGQGPTAVRSAPGQLLPPGTSWGSRGGGVIVGAASLSCLIPASWSTSLFALVSHFRPMCKSPQQDLQLLQQESTNSGMDTVLYSLTVLEASTA